MSRGERETLIFCAMNSWAFTVTVIGTIAILAFGVVPPIGAGFRCEDPNIAHKFTHDSFRTSYLLILALFPIIVIVFLGEFWTLKDISQNARGISWARTKRVYSEYWMAMGLNLLFNEILKTIVAEPRPHFFDSCNPDWSKIDCSQNQGYVAFDASFCQDADTSRNGVPRALTDAMRSFPSGHAQMSVFAAFFAIAYIRKRWISASVVSLLVQVLFVIFAFWASVSRIIDRRHHWWDVLAGIVFGLIASYLSVRHRCKWFSFDEMMKSNQEEDLNKNK